MERFPRFGRPTHRNGQTAGSPDAHVRSPTRFPHPARSRGPPATGRDARSHRHPRPGGTALRGKWLLSAITSGASRAAYRPEGHNRHALSEFLSPFSQTAALCGMVYLPPFVADGMRQRPGEAVLGEFARQYRQCLAALGSGRLQPAAWAGCGCLNEALMNLQTERDHG